MPSGAGSETVTLAEASRRCGVSVATLGHLIEDAYLPQAVRSGQMHLSADHLPDGATVVALVREQLFRRLDAAAAAVATLEREIEAVGYDIAVSREDPEQPLGADLDGLAVRWLKHPLHEALSGLHGVSLEVKLYHQALAREFPR